jgi:class 3 adenylate cyclase/pimeloyl-ACP methyl ester carboxylesterase
LKNLPTGTVTFLFTDIEGSTALLQHLGDRRYGEVLEEHRRLLRDAFVEGRGQEVDTQGDAFLVAFSRARDALAAAVAAQRALTKHPWPDGAPLRVRMGLHTGEPVSGSGDYVGLDVHRAARICAAGHGGQILVSDAVSVLAARDLPSGVSLRDLGTHRLKDLRDPEHLFQVVHSDLPEDFPSIRSVTAMKDPHSRSDLPHEALLRAGPQTKYAKSGDVRVAYQVTGSGAVDVVWAPGTVSHLDLDWDSPRRGPVIRWLSSICRLIRFDKRGTGLSDRPTTVATLEERTDDIRAVMDAASSERAVIFGNSEGASMACLFAATYPERTRSLMIWGGQARWTQAEDYPWGLTPAEHKQMVEDVRERWPSIEYLTGPGAGLGPNLDPAEIERIFRLATTAGSPSAIAALEEMNGQIDIRNILPSIRVPTLVMHRTGDPAANVHAGRDLAAHIPNARFVEFPGNVHSIPGPEFDRIRAEIEYFITASLAPIETDRFLTTMLFAEPVKSRQQATPRSAASLSERYRTFMKAELQRFRGVEVDDAGDRLFARFDGPGRAIRCAVALMKAAAELGLEQRSGVHTGECELVGGKLVGVATVIGRSILARAEPGEVLVSSTVKDLVAGSGFEFCDRGTYEFPGRQQWHLFRVLTR